MPGFAARLAISLMRGVLGGRDPRTMRADDANGLRPMRVMIVDDHEISRAAVSALLRTEGADVADIGTGDAAITVAIAFHPDAAIVDVTPADPAGFLIACQLRALPDAPTVVLTSSSSRCRFGSQLKRHLFVAKADLCARAIEERVGYIL
jgi:CheY-like chemotaxis protein